MSSLPFIHGPRARSDGAPVPVHERRATDVSKGRFADSLASARTDRVDRTPERAAGCMSPRTDRANTAAPASDGEDPSITKARTAAQQRAQLQAVMLSGAMKFAVTRSDAAPTPTLADLVTPQPVVADAGATTVVDSQVSAMLVVAAPDAPSEAAVESPVAQVPALDVNVPAPVLAIALPIAVGPHAMPVVTTIDDSPIADDVAAPADVATAVTTDLSATNAATAAALQLVASLPIDVPKAAPETSMHNATSPNAAAGNAGRPTRRDAAVSSIPATIDPTLVDDHFDAPAAALDATNAAAEAATANVPSTELQRVATSDAAKSDALTATLTTKGGSGTGGVDINGLQADIARLAPEFRERLERVIDRMRQEFGHAVRVIETVRSQARQDALFAQGRTEPGPVVTWTKNSKHGKGLAADLMVDGQWQNPEGYAHLADIAKQEGLRTLGARDPGHVEMTAGGAVSGETLGALLSDLQGDAGDSARQLRANVSSESPAQQQSRSAAMARVSNVAQVARVASVATVAQVARVATVARPGEPAPQTAPSAEVFSPLAVSPVAAVSVGSDASSAVRVATPVSSVNLADRISHLMDLQAMQDAKPLNSVLLRMDNANGIEDQIRIDTRGTSVDARLGLGNAQQAAQFTDRLGELRDALERRGLTADGVRVQTTSTTRSTDSIAGTRTVAPAVELAAMRAAADSQAQGNTRDHSARDQAQREAFARDHSRNTPRPSSDDARQRSRREQPEERR